MHLSWSVLTVCHLYSAGRSAEYTEVPLGALDIAAADSLTLSPHHGRFMMDKTRNIEKPQWPLSKFS